MNISAAVKLALSVLAVFAKPGGDSWFDKVYALLVAIGGNDTLLNFLDSLIHNPAVQSSHGAARTEAIEDAAQQAKTPEVEAALNAAGIPWALLLSLAPDVVRKILTLIGKR